MSQNGFDTSSSLVTLFRDGQPVPLRLACVECTHCHHVVRLSETSIAIQPASAQLEAPSPPPLTPAPLSAPTSPVMMDKMPRSPDSSGSNTEEEIYIVKAEVEEPAEDKKWRWSPELKEHFVKAFEILQSRGIHATPKKIMGLMRQNGAPVEQLTMRRVQSHHQKYLKRLKTTRSGKKSKAAQKKAAATEQQQLPKLTDLSESSSYGDAHFDAEVLRLTGGLEPGTSSNRDDVGSPMFFTSIAGSPTPGLRSPTPTTPIASPQMASYQFSRTPSSRSVHHPVPVNFSRTQSPAFSGNFMVPAPQKPTTSSPAQQRAKFTPNPNSELFGSVANVSWQQYMVSGTVVKPGVDKPQPLSLQALSSQQQPLQLSPASAFSKMSLQHQPPLSPMGPPAPFSQYREEIYTVPSPRAAVHQQMMDDPFLAAEATYRTATLEELMFPPLPTLSEALSDGCYDNSNSGGNGGYSDLLGFMNDDLIALAQ